MSERIDDLTREVIELTSEKTALATARAVVKEHVAACPALAVFAVAAWFWAINRKPLLIGVGICGLFGALFSGLAYWGKTVAGITLGLFGVVLLAALLAAVWYGVHLWVSHRAEIERRLLGVKP